VKKECLFPKIDSFSFSIFHNESLCDTESDAALLVAEEDSEILLGRRVYLLSKGNALLALPYSYLRQKESRLPFPGYRLSFPCSTLRAFAPRLHLYSADGGMALSFHREHALRLLSLCAALSDDTALWDIPLFFSILENQALPQTDISLEIALPKLLRRALGYIEEKAPYEVGVAELAARYEVSESTLLRAFRKYLGTTPHKYAKALRLLYHRKNGVD